VAKSSNPVFKSSVVEHSFSYFHKKTVDTLELGPTYYYKFKTLEQLDLTVLPARDCSCTAECIFLKAVCWKKRIETLAFSVSGPHLNKLFRIVHLSYMLNDK
jgi:hypothetical protein